MKLTVLGSGTSIPHPTRSSPANWLETACGTVLLDIGPDAPHRMAQEQLDWPNLDAIWVSHFHLDHFGGLPPFLFGARWAPQMSHRRKPLRIIGPQGLASLLNRTNDSNNYKLFDQVFPIDLVEVEAGKEFELLTGLIANTFSTPHTSESLALRLTEESGKSIVYTSDTGVSEGLIDFAAGTRLLLLECSFRRNKPSQTHLELLEAMTVAERCRPETLVLTHLYPEWDQSNVRTEAEKLWEGRIVEALDGLALEY